MSTLKIRMKVGIMKNLNRLYLSGLGNRFHIFSYFGCRLVCKLKFFARMVNWVTSLWKMSLGTWRKTSAGCVKKSFNIPSWGWLGGIVRAGGPSQSLKSSRSDPSVRGILRKLCTSNRHTA